MCTVTYTPGQHGIYLVSNRDEQWSRLPASPPEIFPMTTGRVLFPKDGQAGGSWIALHENGHAVVLLNGAFSAHPHTPPYRQSRGLILLEIADSLAPADAFAAADLQGIEPFTVIVCDGQALWDCRWDGSRKHISTQDSRQAHTWSSCTLYTEEVMAQRKVWFNAFLEEHPSPGFEDLIWFHQHGGNGDPSQNLLMQRHGLLGTVSITALHLRREIGRMHYLDLRNDTASDMVIPFLHPSGTP